jgi:hypothetical protein
MSIASGKTIEEGRARLSGKDVGNIIASETEPKMIPLMTPEITFDIRLSI